jgi:CheY-like chemotaxis protein
MKKGYVLIVEDNVLNARLMGEYLSRKGLEFLVAGDGETAIEMVKKYQNITVVLMDIGLPNMSGDQAMAEIKKIKYELPVIAQTAYTFADSEDNYLSAGFDGYIAKPINFSSLDKVLAKYAYCENMI